MIMRILIQIHIKFRSETKPTSCVENQTTWLPRTIHPANFMKHLIKVLKLEFTTDITIVESTGTVAGVVAFAIRVTIRVTMVALSARSTVIALATRVTTRTMAARAALKAVVITMVSAVSVFLAIFLRPVTTDTAAVTTFAVFLAVLPSISASVANTETAGARATVASSVVRSTSEFTVSAGRIRLASVRAPFRNSATFVVSARSVAG